MDRYINEDTYIEHVMNIKVNTFQNVLLEYCLNMYYIDDDAPIIDFVGTLMFLN